MTEPTPKNPIKTHRKKPFFLWLVLLMLSLASTFSMRMLYLKQQLLETHLKSIQIKQDHANSASEIAIQSVKLELEKISQTQKEISVEEEGTLYKALFAIELAQLNAEWGNDSVTTIALLKKADVLLSQTNDAALFAVRQALAHEISLVESQPVVDVAGLLSQLDALQKLVDDYTPTTQLSSTITPSNSTPDYSRGTWQERLKQTLLSFKQFFIIRHHDNPLEPLMSPAFLTAQKEIIRLRLQEAEWAILQKNEAIYKLTIKQACDNIMRGFDTKNPVVMTLLKSLEKLQSTSLQTQAFIPNESLPLLEAILKKSSSEQPGASS